MGARACAGLFAIIPVPDAVIAIIDERIHAEQALTKDTVPVLVDAIIFWHVGLPRLPVNHCKIRGR